jgi:protein TonB
MFEALERNGRTTTTGRFRALLISVFLHAIMITIGVVLPMVFLQVLPGIDLLTYLAAAPAPPATPEAPPPPREPAAARGEQAQLTIIDFIKPPEMPRGIPAPIGESSPVIGIVHLDGIGPSGSVIGGPTNGLIGDLLAPVAPPKPAPPAPPPEAVRIGGEVQESKLIRKVVPEYPRLARVSRVEDIVVLEITVDEEGNVSGARVLRGHPLLVDEALQAVKQWKYSPTLLNREPVKVISMVTMIFRLK